MIFEVIDQFHRKVCLSEERFKHILERSEMKQSLRALRETILVPEIIKQSKHAKKVWLYYRFYDKTPVTQKYLAAIIKILNHEAFIITSYYTNKIKEGVTLWKR